MARKILLVLLLSLLPLALFFFAIPAHASTIIIVNSNLDVINPNDGNCTLREAIIAANTDTASGGAYAECPAGSGADTILLPPGTYTLTISGSGEGNSATGDLDIKQDVTIEGNGFGCLFNINCTAIKANDFDRVIDITSTAHVTITGLDIMLGDNNDFGGGGVRNYGVLKLTDVYFSNNFSAGFGGGLLNEPGAFAVLDTVGFVLNHSNSFGGAIYNEGTLTLTNNLFTFDTASYGGGLSNYGIATLTDTTVAHETATFDGGGIYNSADLILNRVTLDHNQTTNGKGAGIYAGWNVTLTNVTLSANSAISTTSQGGAIYAGGLATSLTNVTIYSNTATAGGGIYNNAGTVSLKNTIVTNSPTGGNCAGGAVTSLGYNLDGRDTCAFSATGDITFTVASLGPLANNGGTTFTHALLPGSPAINKIPFGTNGCGTTITTDQRGYARVAPCDIGAFEYVLRLFLPLIEK